MATVRKRQWRSGGKRKEAWVVDYFDTHKRRHIETFKLRREADARLVEITGELRKGTHTSVSTSKTVRQAAKLWIERCEEETPDYLPLEPATVREYQGHIDRYIDHPDIGIGGRKLAELTFADVKAFERRLKDANRSPAMIRKVRTSLSALLSDAMENGLVGKHVIRDIQRNRKRKHKDRQERKFEMPDKAELRAMIEKAGDDFRPLLVTAIFTGMRISEMRGLTWEYVDFGEGVIRVRQRADRYNTIGPPKTAAGNRDIPMTPIVTNGLRTWRMVQRRRWDERIDQAREKGHPAPAAPEYDLVFPTRLGTIQNLGNLYRRGFAPLQVACGITLDSGRKDKDGNPVMRARHGFHALRHAAASLFIEQGFTPKKVQTLMGHSSIQMTFDTYGHLFKDPESDAEAFEQIQARLVG